LLGLGYLLRVRAARSVAVNLIPPLVALARVAGAEGAACRRRCAAGLARLAATGPAAAALLVDAHATACSSRWSVAVR
jgi:hypothetical protein